MDIGAVRRGLAFAAQNAAGDTGLTCLPYVPDSITPPTCYVARYVIDRTSDANMLGGGIADIRVTCRVLVARSDDQSAQELLDAFLAGEGVTSLVAAIEAEPSLGGVCDDVHVVSAEGPDLYSIAGTAYLGADLVVQVYGIG